MAQVGINTIEPKSLLDVVVDDPDAPKATDGILIPRVNVLPSGIEFPTIEQTGMIIYLTTIDGSNPAGFYFFNGSSFVNVNDTASGAFVNNDATGNLASNTTANIRRSGNVSIGGSLNSGRLNIEISSTEPLTGLARTALKLDNSNSSTAQGNTYGIDSNNATTPSRSTDPTDGSRGNKVGIRSIVTAAGTANHVGFLNEVFDNSSATNGGNVIGIDNKIGNIVGSGLDNYGIRSIVGDGSSTGNIYGVYSEVVGSTSTNKYSGIFIGPNFGIRNSNLAGDGYNLPTTDGLSGQVLTTNGAGVASWQSISETERSSIRTINTGTIADTDDTVLITGDISIPEASAANLGKKYTIALGLNSDNLTITTSGNGFFYPGNSSVSSTFNLNKNPLEQRSVTVQSDGTKWVIINLIRN
ncbi:hypothetical protein BST86_06365 [Nonlabens agnitus]|uniref:Uncharacterized protein n=2 Tax=Nonlabens agnitus TaxID=870484 RepID=A0A2S9WTG7_9FLAO|nr:hypothetical protein BST86_06365 [Nonlabens agnitus]